MTTALERDRSPGRRARGRGFRVPKTSEVIARWMRKEIHDQRLNPGDALPSETEPVSPESGPLIAREAAPEHGEPFVALRGSKLFHRRECTWVARIAELDRVYLKRVPEALEQGYVTCPVCEPWEPA